MAQKITEESVKRLRISAPSSHKGQNGRVLIIAGSKKFHGAMLLAMQAASRIVDMVYVYSSRNNLRLIEMLKQKMAVFIAVNKKELWSTIELVDTVIMGPGLPETDETIALVHDILTRYPEKKTVVDATALWHVQPAYLHSNCIVTPHSREFRNVFQVEPTGEQVFAMAAKHHCVIVLKGQIDYISDGIRLYENHTGNVGMTKGGTGDVLAGMIGALAATNDSLLAAEAGTYLNGLLGERLSRRVGTFYNAEDIVAELGILWKELRQE